MIRSCLISMFFVKFADGAAYIGAGMLTLTGLNHLEVPVRGTHPAPIPELSRKFPSERMPMIISAICVPKCII